VNSNTASSAGGSQSVVVAATNKLDILTFAGGLGLSLGGGIGASADIGILRNDTQAYIGDATVRAKSDTDVFALSRWTINSNAISAGGGAVGLGGGITVYTIGGDFTDSYSGGGASANALSGKNSTVLDFIEGTVNSMSSTMQNDDASPPAFD